MPRRLALIGLFVALAGCAKQEAKVDSTAAAVPEPNVVTFTTKDFGFEGPDTIPGGLTTLVMKNQGSVLHHVQLIRLNDGKTFADFGDGLKKMKPTDAPPPWIMEAGGVNAAPPGGESSAMLNIEPGNYAIICFVDIPDKVPHFAKGMLKALTVTAAPAVAAKPPEADLTMTLNDFSFTFSAPPTQGHHVIKVENVGTQHHEFVLIKLDAGKTVEDLGKWAATYKGPPPGTAMGGTPGFMPGNTHYVPLDLTAGNYVAMCFVPDVKDGKPHIDHGMVLPFTVN